MYNEGRRNYSLPPFLLPDSFPLGLNRADVLKDFPRLPDEKVAGKKRWYAR